MKKYNQKRQPLKTLKLLAITLLIISSPALVYSKDKTNADYQITVKSRNVYIPYHHLGLEKILFSNKDFKDIRINIRAGSVKFKMTATKKPEEKDITDIFNQVSLKPTSINIRKIRK